MADTISAVATPGPLQTMISITGTLEAPGAQDNPVILGWANAIASRFPEMLAYSSLYKHDETAWCGLTTAYCMAMNGIRPPFKPGDDLNCFLWADAWSRWGIASTINAAEPGDILVFKWASGGHHVTLLDHADGDTFYCRGGNQGDAVKVSPFLKNQCYAVRKAPATAAVKLPASITMALSKLNNFDPCVAVVLKQEGGNDDDKRDPGGRTSRGILQKEWDVYRQSHPGLPSDVWQAPQEDIVAIYHQSYWDVVWGDKLPNGVDLAVFDMAVLQGVGRVGDVQAIVGSDVDNEMGPNTIAAVHAYVSGNGAAALVNAICDKRLARLQGSKNFGTFGRGWTNRIRDVRAAALAMAAAAPVEQEEPMTDGTVTTPTPTATPVPAIDPNELMKNLAQLTAQLPEILGRIRALEANLIQLRTGVLNQVDKIAAVVPPATVPVAAVTAADKTNKTGLGAGIFATIATLLLGAGGVTGTPVGETATLAGAALPLASVGVSMLGAFGKLAPLLRGLMAVL